jgi:hypothetical protein
MKFFRLSTLLISLYLPVTAVGHHSFATTFDPGRIDELEGQVTDVRWRNPHVSFTLRTVDEGGAEVLWAIESHSLSIMRRMDLATAFIEVGDNVKVAGNPARRSDLNAMFAQNILLPSGEEWVFRVGGGDLRWSDRLMGTTERWFATEGERSEAELGIFRVWSTSFTAARGGFGMENYPLTDAARAVLADFDPIAEAPLANCAPKGMPYIMSQPYPMEFVEENDRILLRIEEYDLVRTIYMNEGAPAEAQVPSLLGYSVGRWEDDTLVVRTTGVNYPYYNESGIPLSGEGEYIERIAATDDGSRLSYEITITAPATFTEPLVFEKSWVWLSDVSVEPYECAVGE